MSKMISGGLLFWVLLMMFQPALAGNILEPGLLEMTDDWLTSDPQVGVDYHVFRVCRDADMTLDCTQGIYKAKDNGAVWIPVNNRCIYRVQKVNYHNLFYQIKAAAVDGAQSEWTQPRKLLVYQEIVNLGTQSYNYTIVTYDTSDSLQQP